MRVWDQIEPERLCRVHLLGEHREIHALWSILERLDAGQESGYANHPETLRWVDLTKRRYLYLRHVHIAQEMRKRDYAHRSPLPQLSRGPVIQPAPWDDQLAALAAKHCCGPQQPCAAVSLDKPTQPMVWYLDVDAALRSREI